MKSETITLREERSGKSWNLSARITEDGDLSIEGQDLGPGVEKFWGTGNTEYEWDIKVRAAHFPQLIAALGGKEGDDVLTLLARRFSESDEYASETFLQEKGVPIEFWGRVGD